MSHYNRLLTAGNDRAIDTFFLTADPAYLYISGNAVKETAQLVFKNGFDEKALFEMVTPEVLEALRERLI
jgi:phosphopantetheine adenylyltransferase